MTHDQQHPLVSRQNADSPGGRPRLLQWGFLFLLATGIAALFGFGNIRPETAEIGRALSYLFLALAVGSFLAHAYRRRTFQPDDGH